MKLVIAATGASGTIYLQRLLEQIDAGAHEVHLVISAHAKQVAAQELEQLKIPKSVTQHAENDLNVPFVSGSAHFDAMVIVPCSMATLGRIASGSSDSALLRAADVFLKERRKLVLVPRETPWNLIHARNVVTFHPSTAVQLQWSMLSIRWFGAFSIKSVCPVRARIAGQIKPRKVESVEDRRMAGALVDRVWISFVAGLGADIAFRSGRSGRAGWQAGQSKLCRRALAQSFTPYFFCVEKVFSAAAGCRINQRQSRWRSCY